MSRKQKDLLTLYDDGTLLAEANRLTLLSGNGRLRRSDGSYLDIGGSTRGYTRTLLYDWEPRSASTEAATGVIAGLSAKNRRTYWEVSAEGSQARQQWTTDFKATVNCNEEAAAAYWGSLSKRQKEFYITKYQCR